MKIPELKLEKWFEGKSAAVAITLDDWTPGQFELGAPALLSRGLPASFYVTLHNMQMLPSYDHWGKLQELISCGYEIGNHTMTHQDLTTASTSDCMHEIYAAKKIIDSHLVGSSVETFAYPFGRFNDDVIEKVMHGHIGARAFYSEMPPEIGKWPEHLNQYADKFFYDFAESEKDYFFVNQFRMNDDVSAPQVEMFIERVIRNNGLVPLVFHGIYNDVHRLDAGMYDAIHELHFQDILRVLTSLKEQIWITTFSAAVKYHRAAKATSIRSTWHDDYPGGGSRYEFHLQSSDPYRSPKLHSLTLSTDIEEGRRCVLISQGEKEIGFRAIGNSIQFEVQPVESIIALRVDNI